MFDSYYLIICWAMEAHRNEIQVYFHPIACITHSISEVFAAEKVFQTDAHTHTTKYLIVSNAGNRHLFVSGYHWNTMCSMHEVLLFGLNLRFGWRKCTFRFRLTAPHKSNKTVVSPAKSIPQLETHANTKSQEFINQTHQSPEPQNKYYIFCFVQTSQ